VISLWATVKIDGVEASGWVQVAPGTWGDRWSPAEAPEILSASLTDQRHQPVRVDLDNEVVHNAILAGIEWPREADEPPWRQG